jgi:iron complex outermembrane recepter protein
MRLIHSASRFALSASALALGAAWASPASAAQPVPPQNPVTPSEAQECAKLPTQQERLQCVQAQAQPEGTADQAGDIATLPPAQAAKEQAQGGAIVVTGSRIRRNEFTSPDPIQIINPELGAKEGKQTTVDLINSTPIAAGSVQITSAISTNFVTEGGEGAQTVSLRGLGANRTLVLLNGRRAGPAGVRGQVDSFDLNVLPSSIVSTIEILKTGASSVYGSDAIAGVVNILTKKSTNGIELNGFSSIPVHGGGETYDVNATYGKDFGRGHFLVTADYFRQQDIERRDRPFLDCAEEFLPLQDGPGVADIRDVRTGKPACNGVLHNSIITANDFTGPLNFDTGFFDPGLTAPNGQPLFVTQFQVGNELAQAGCIPLNGFVPTQTNPDGTPGVLPDAPVVAPPNAFGCNFNGPTTGVLNQYSEKERGTDVQSDLMRRTLYAEGSFEVTPGIELYTELLYNRRKTNTDGIAQLSSVQFTGGAANGLSLPQFFCTGTEFNCHPELSSGDPFNSEFQGRFLLIPLILTEADSGTDIKYARGVLGARGDFGDLNFLHGWNYDIYGQYSRSSGTYFQDYTRADSIFTQDFRTGSCVGMFTPVDNLPCMDIDFTDPRVLAGNFTPEERAFLFGRDVGHTLYTQLSGEASVSGNVIDLPAGPLGVALGGTIRRDKINDTPGLASQNDNRFNLTSSGITAGSTVTKELFGEADIPILRNQPFVQALTLSASGRLTKVDAKRSDGESDSFGDHTYKLGADWGVNDWLRFRGSYGTSFRAPALFELFLQNQTGFGRQQDLDICSNRVRALELGTITQREFDNCTAAGIPLNFQAATGGVTIIGGGGLGNLKPETSKAKVFSVVLTPTFNVLPDTRFSVAVDYFDISVANEISQLGAGSIINGCYNSEHFATEPLCNLITRVPAGAVGQFNLVSVRDTYININSQRNRGVDLTGQIVHNMGSWGRLSFLAQMTWQIEDTQEVFSGDEFELNGTIGDPRWVGNFNLTWSKGPWTLLYGLDVIGSADNRNAMIEQLGNRTCLTSIFRTGTFCPISSVPSVWYHALSLTRDIGDKYRFTLGVANLFDKKPPRVSTIDNGGVSTLGQVPVFGSQYDYLGRRLFLNVRAKI